MQDYKRALAEAKALRRRETEKATAGHEAEAARALAAGRPDTLRPAAVLHLQRTAGNAGVVQLLGDEQAESPVKGVVGHGGGAPLDGGVRQRMEASFGQDFSDVRVHAGGSAGASAAAVDAHAYTVGNEIVLGSDQEPGSPAHERTLAHELTHVVQQRSGPVDGTEAPGGIRLSSPGDRFERAAEATADAVMAGGTPGQATMAAAPAAQALSTQRQGEAFQELGIQRQVAPGEEEGPEEEIPEEVQPLAIQRAGAPGEPEIEEQERELL